MSTLPQPPHHNHDRTASYPPPITHDRNPSSFPWQEAFVHRHRYYERQPSAPPRYATRATARPQADRDPGHPPVPVPAAEPPQARAAINNIWDLAEYIADSAFQALNGLDSTEGVIAALEERVKRLEADLAAKVNEATQLQNELIYTKKALQGREWELHDAKQQLQSTRNAVVHLDAERSEYEYEREAQRTARKIEEREAVHKGKEKERVAEEDKDRVVMQGKETPSMNECEVANMAAQRLMELLEEALRNKGKRLEEGDKDGGRVGSAAGVSRPEVASPHSETGSESPGRSKSLELGSKRFGARNSLSLNVFKSRSLRDRPKRTEYAHVPETPRHSVSSNGNAGDIQSISENHRRPTEHNEHPDEPQAETSEHTGGFITSPQETAVVWSPIDQREAEGVAQQKFPEPLVNGIHGERRVQRGDGAGDTSPVSVAGELESSEVKDSDGTDSALRRTYLNVFKSRTERRRS